MKQTTALAVLLSVLLTASAPHAAYQGKAVSNGGAITGTVSFQGTPPDPTVYTVSKDTHVCGTGTHTGEDVAIGPDKGLRYVVVSLIDISEGMPLDTETTPTLDQKGCWFNPHVVLVPRGATLDILNNDGILHNVRTTSKKNSPFNKAQPKFVKKLRQTFTAAPEFIKVNCDAHSWMSAWIVVQEHPYYAVTDESGAFTLSNIPPGTYTLKYWHERFGEQTAEVTVAAGATTMADMTFGE